MKNDFSHVAMLTGVLFHLILRGKREYAMVEEDSADHKSDSKRQVIVKLQYLHRCNKHCPHCPVHVLSASKRALFVLVCLVYVIFSRTGLTEKDSLVYVL